MRAAVLLNTDARPIEAWSDPTRGSVRWQSLFSAGFTQTDSMTCGVAHVAPGDTFTLHCHPQAEIYFCLSGHCTVLVNGLPYALSPGVALFIPGGAVHGIVKAEAEMSWFYVFATDSFDQIAYDFQPPDAPPLQMPPVDLEQPGEQE